MALDTSHFEMSALNDRAPENIPLMSLTRDMSHFEMSALNDRAFENTLVMLVTLDTSHSPIGPCVLSVQLPLGDSFRHAFTALSSSDWDCGENTELVVIAGMADGGHSVRNIDPGESVNINF